MICLPPHLPAGFWEEAADAAAAGAAVRAVIPNDLARDSRLSGTQAGAAAAEGVRAGSRKIHVIFAVADAVGGAAVAGGHAYRNAHSRCGLKGIVHRRHRLR